MKILFQLLIGALIGFLVSYVALNNLAFDLSQYSEMIVIGILVAILVLLILCIVLYTQIKKLYSSEVFGDEEDEVDAVMYKKFSDFTLFGQSSIVLSLLVLCISVIMEIQIVYVVLGMVSLIASYLLTLLSVNLMRFIYPERNLPPLSEKKYGEKLLAIADDGERHVMLIGLYKSYNFVSIALVIAILFATFYSVSSGNSQLFSIIVMSIVLLCTHGKYCIAIRNK
nr:DUF3169 family protein [Lysinibacillus timonensis]